MCHHCFCNVQRLATAISFTIFIGSLLLLIVIVCKLTIHSETVDDIHIYVHDFSDKSKLNRHSKLKRIVYLILWIVYMVLIANIVTPNINHTSNYEWVFEPSWLILGVGVVVALCMFDDKRIKYTEMDTPTIENRGASPKGVIDLIPNYRYADEQQKLVILKVHATNFIWMTIGLTIVCIIDIIIELIMQQMPLAVFITIIVIVVELLILKLKTNKFAAHFMNKVLRKRCLLKILIDSVFIFNLYKIYGILIKKCNNMYVKKSVLKI